MGSQHRHPERSLRSRGISRVCRREILRLRYAPLIMTERAGVIFGIDAMCVRTPRKHENAARRAERARCGHSDARGPQSGSEKAVFEAEDHALLQQWVEAWLQKGLFDQQQLLTEVMGCIDMNPR